MLRLARSMTEYKRSITEAYFSLLSLPLATLHQARALLAKWFHFSPSEIDALLPEEFEEWITLAQEQIDANNRANRA